MKINNISNEKNVATLSIVFNMTTNCRLKAGIKRTNFRIRNKRKVRKTDTPLLPPTSLSLGPKLFINSYTLKMLFEFRYLSKVCQK
jgi:hypothetical protein